MSQAGFRFFNTKHSMASLPHPPLVTLQITNLGLICPCSRWHIQLQHPPKPTLNLKGPKTAVAAVSPAGGQAQAVLLGHGCAQLHGAPGTSRDGNRDLQTLRSHHIQIIGSCGTSTSRERGLIVMSYISVWHPWPLNICICLGTVIPFVCFLLTQTVICLIYALLN